MASYEPETTAKIIAALAQGNTLETAALGAGVNPRTVREWMTKYPDFEANVEATRAACRSVYVSVVHQAAVEGDVKAAQWMMERGDPENWGRHDRADLALRRLQAEQIAEQLALEGITVTVEEVQEAASRLGRKALPDGSKPRH